MLAGTAVAIAAPGAGGVAGTGGLNSPGENGIVGVRLDASNRSMGNGGSGPFGAGGSSTGVVGNGGNGIAGTGNGSGGSGATAGNNTARSGGPGAIGAILVVEYGFV